MKLIPLALFLSCSPLPILAGCGAADTSGGVVDDASEAVVGEDDLTGISNFGYMVVTRPDARKCAAPLCGGYFVKRVNQVTTRCADGGYHAECYVASITFPGAGLSTNEQQALLAAAVEGKAVLRAATYKKKKGGAVYGTLKANEGWLGATLSPVSGTFYRAADNGIRCITAPCPTTTAYELNGHDDYNVIDVNLTGTSNPASADSLDRASAALATSRGILVAGGVALPKCVPGSNCGPILMAEEFFLRVTHTEGVGCGGRGGGQCNADQFCHWDPAGICGAADASGTCAYRPEVCPQYYLAVCGCDGKTYGNECFAAAAGTSVASTGACSKSK